MMHLHIRLYESRLSSSPTEEESPWYTIRQSLVKSHDKLPITSKVLCHATMLHFWVA